MMLAEPFLPHEHISLTASLFLGGPYFNWSQYFGEDDEDQVLSHVLQLWPRRYERLKQQYRSTAYSTAESIPSPFIR